MAVTLCVGMPPATLQGRRYRTAGAVKAAFPRGSAHRYTQVLGVRLFGMDAEIQRPRMANCGTQQMPLYPRTGNQGLANRLNHALMLRNPVMCNQHGAIASLSSKGAFVAEKPVRPVTVNLPIAISPITCAFTLRRCAVA